ncbi:NmrA family transcriptional regulator [Kibdelosporangium sp. 4NS15]|uniref:NmrA family transcriptional regulator n=1 Tax=Kibdelosporangium persicum TaxID=2698649 RepID=A0ABX2F319_9PSEU|nr:NAD(P)H-binding protein [Kibdelosporangium persicum]NRN65235.1 NmrA family transcriptional regulator [Kibdelosporangium persicum]
MTENPILILGGTGKTGGRIADRLTARGVPVRIGSRSAEPAFHWEDDSTWAPVLRGAAAVYIAYYPDIGAAGASTTVGSFAKLAVSLGVTRIVLLSGRGEQEAERSEQAVRESGAEWTVLRASWFAQNFSESFLLDPVLSGQVRLPAGAVVEPFVDVDDIADVAVAALTEPGHVGELYELTGPYAVSFADAIAEISAASGREISYEKISIDEFAAGLAHEIGDQPEYIDFLKYLFTDILDGRNAQPQDGVRRALGREPRSFRDYAKTAAATGVWATNA